MKKYTTLLIFCTVIIALVLLVFFISSYIISPLFSSSSVLMPASCTGTISQLPPSLDYVIPDIGTGTLLTSDTTSAVIVMVDYGKLPLTSTVFLIRKSDNKILQTFKFNNDIVNAGIYDGTLYLFNDKIGYILNASTGEYMHHIFTIDNYRGLYTLNGTQYLQTTLEISGLKSDGSIVSHRRVDMKSIAFGCLILK
jgi:hypothetical protein